MQSPRQFSAANTPGTAQAFAVDATLIVHCELMKNTLSSSDCSFQIGGEISEVLISGRPA